MEMLLLTNETRRLTEFTSWPVRFLNLPRCSIAHLVAFRLAIRLEFRTDPYEAYVSD
jgi:hypothetical protein